MLKSTLSFILFIYCFFGGSVLSFVEITNNTVMYKVDQAFSKYLALQQRTFEHFVFQTFSISHVPLYDFEEGWGKLDRNLQPIS